MISTRPLNPMASVWTSVLCIRVSLSSKVSGPTLTAGMLTIFPSLSETLRLSSRISPPCRPMMCDSVRPQIFSASVLTPGNIGSNGCRGTDRVTDRKPSRAIPTAHQGHGESETLPLNQKQFLVVRKILNHAIRHHGTPALEVADQPKMLLAVAGEGQGCGARLRTPAPERGCPSARSDGHGRLQHYHPHRS
jgi:hypothetical protein